MASQRKNSVLVSAFIPPIFLELSTAWFCLVEMCLRFSVVLHLIHCQFIAQVMVMVAAAGLSFTASVFISAYSFLTFTYGEEDEDVFHHHSSTKVVTILNTRTRSMALTLTVYIKVMVSERLVKGWMAEQNLSY